MIFVDLEQYELMEYEMDIDDHIYDAIERHGTTILMINLRMQVGTLIFSHSVD